jgi:TctA family transporter
VRSALARTLLLMAVIAPLVMGLVLGQLALAALRDAKLIESSAAIASHRPRSNCWPAWIRGNSDDLALLH